MRNREIVTDRTSVLGQFRESRYRPKPRLGSAVVALPSPQGNGARVGNGLPTTLTC